MTIGGGDGSAEDARADEARAELRGVRRIFIVALAAAIVAAAVTFTVELTQHAATPASPASTLLPAIFRQPGFSEGTLHRRRQVAVPAGVQRYVLRTNVPAGTEVYLVATCDRGTVTVRLGALTSSQRCSGRPIGLARLAIATRDARIEATVDRPQTRDWALGIYR